MNLNWFLRMVRWARHPPSEKRVILVFSVIVIALAFWGWEQLFGWPEALTPQGGTRGHRIPKF